MKPYFKLFSDLALLTQFGFSLVTPVVLCVGGAFWLHARWGAPAWVIAPGFVLGFGAAASTAWHFYKRTCRKAEKDGRKAAPRFNDHT